MKYKSVRGGGGRNSTKTNSMNNEAMVGLSGDAGPGGSPPTLALNSFQNTESNTNSIYQQPEFLKMKLLNGQRFVEAL